MITVIYERKKTYSCEPPDLELQNPKLFFFVAVVAVVVNIALVNTFTILTHDYVWISQ